MTGDTVSVNQMRTPAYGNNYHQRTHGAGDDNRRELRAQEIEILHYANAYWHEQKRHMTNQLVAARFDPLCRDDLKRQEKKQNQHTDDTAR